jgi:hypothetical protein
MARRYLHSATAFAFVLTSFVVCPPPVQADDLDEIYGPPPFSFEGMKDPEIAANLSYYSPLGMIAPMMFVTEFPSDLRIIPIGLALLSPLASGAGQVYAGDPLRGLLIGTGGVVAVNGAGALATMIATNVIPPPKYSFDYAPVILVAAIVFNVAYFTCWGYSTFAGFDAAETARRQNRKILKLNPGLAPKGVPFDLQ